MTAHDEPAGRARIADLRRLARGEFQREVQVWTSRGIVCRPTEREAHDFARYYIVECGDWEAVASISRGRYAARPRRSKRALRA